LTDEGYEPKDVSERIAYGHAQKHIGYKREKWSQLGVDTVENFRKHIYKTLIDKDTLAFRARNNRDIYYNEKTNTFISVDLSRSDRGTCYRPTSKKKAFQEEYENDIKIRGNLKLEKQQVLKGGYPSLHKTNKNLIHQKSSDAKSKTAAERFVSLKKKREESRETVRPKGKTAEGRLKRLKELREQKRDIGKGDNLSL
jgi:hypothetical protein